MVLKNNCISKLKQSNKINEVNLPKQHKYHIQSKKSIRFIENLLPDEWIVRQINPDYGIDLEIEIWNEEPVGRTVYLQVKSLENFPKKDNGTYTIKKSTLNYLNQKQHSFILFIINNIQIEILKVADLLAIYVANFSKKDSKSVSIPLVLKKQSSMYHHDFFYKDFAIKHRLKSTLSGKVYYSDKAKNIKYYQYFSNFNNESEFWRFETYWTIGSLYRGKRTSKSVAKKLLKNYERETDFGKAGILGAISQLQYTSKSIQKSAKKLIHSKEPIIFLMAIRNLIECETNENLDFIKNLIQNNKRDLTEKFKMKVCTDKLPTDSNESIYWSQQFYFAVISSAIISLSNSRTKEGMEYFVQKFLECAYHEILPSYTDNLWMNMDKDFDYKNNVIRITKKLVSLDFKNSEDVIKYLKKMSTLSHDSKY